jgi:hypothetical protein
VATTSFANPSFCAKRLLAVRAKFADDPDPH